MRVLVRSLARVTEWASQRLHQASMLLQAPERVVQLEHDLLETRQSFEGCKEQLMRSLERERDLQRQLDEESGRVMGWQAISAAKSREAGQAIKKLEKVLERLQHGESAAQICADVTID